MHSDASGYVRMHSDMIGKNFETKLLETSDDQIWRTFGEVFEELRQNGRHKQVPRNFDPDTFIWSSIRWRLKKSLFFLKKLSFFWTT